MRAMQIRKKSNGREKEGEDEAEGEKIEKVMPKVSREETSKEKEKNKEEELLVWPSEVPLEAEGKLTEAKEIVQEVCESKEIEEEICETPENKRLQQRCYSEEED